MTQIVKEFSGDYTNDQEIFDFIVSSIVRQGQPSLDKDGHPTLHARNNIRCSVGWLITSDEYKDEMNDNFGETLSEIANKKKINKKLLIRISEAHDYNTSIARAIFRDNQTGNFIECFKKDIKNIAAEFELKYKYI